MGRSLGSTVVLGVTLANSVVKDEPVTGAENLTAAEMVILDGDTPERRLSPPNAPSTTDSLSADELDPHECEECAELPGEFPCASCYVSGRKDFPEEA